MHQRPLRKVKQSLSRERWIVATLADKEFCLESVKLDENGILQVDACKYMLPYTEFWQSLADLNLEDRKYWLIGWRTRMMLSASAFLEELENERVALPSSQREDGTRKRKGKLTVSPNCIEVDVVCGKNRIKLLDFDNYGILPGDFGLRFDSMTFMDVRQVMQGFLVGMGQVGLPVTRTTAAQLGWSHFRSTCAPDVMSVNLDDEARALERKAYFGGRCEAYQLGDIEGITYSLDVKSCYANIAATCPVPVHLDKEFRAGLPVEQIDSTDGVQWIADVIVETDQADYPMQWEGGPIYPTGTFRTALCWPELKHALDHNRVRRVIRAARYYAEPAMQAYAKWFQEAKAMLPTTGCEQFQGALKAVFNASLGYMARRKYEWQPWSTDLGRKWCIGVTEAPDHSAPVVSCQILDGNPEWLRVGGEPREAMPVVHATITSWARLKLLEIFGWAGRDNILYCDTDGILVTHRGLCNLMDSPGLIGEQPGQLTERFPAGTARIQGQKSYRVGGNFVQSGVVRTRYSGMVEKSVLVTTTGLTTADGKVYPYKFACDDEGGESEKLVNRLD